MSEKRPILVTGASGLIGRWIVEMLAVDGRATLATDRIRAVDEGSRSIWSTFTPGQALRSSIAGSAYSSHETAGPDRTLSPTGQPAVLESLDSISVSIEDVLV
jgi:nucleoside-diphosphate-sugar epimerase